MNTNNLKTVFFLGLLTALVLAIGTAVGGQNGLMIAIAMAAVMNLVSFFYGDRLALMSVGAREVGEDSDFYRLVADLAQRAQLPMPRVYISPQAAPNAFATGRGPRHASVCATAGLLQMLDRREVAAVMSHELAHVRHRDILTVTVAATIASAISMLGYMFWFGGSDRENRGVHPVVAILGIVVGPLAAGLIQAAISRSREFNADTAGAEICGDPMALATALEKIHHRSSQIPLDVNPALNSLFIAEPLNFSGSRQLANLFQTHPPLDQRLMNLIGRPTVHGGR